MGRFQRARHLDSYVESFPQHHLCCCHLLAESLTLYEFGDDKGLAF